MTGNRARTTRKILNLMAAEGPWRVATVMHASRPFVRVRPVRYQVINNKTVVRSCSCRRSSHQCDGVVVSLPNRQVKESGGGEECKESWSLRRGKMGRCLGAEDVHDRRRGSYS
jgi:hypothetical protein